MIAIEKLDVYNDLDERIINFIKKDWGYSYPDRDKSLKFPINIHISRKYNNKTKYLVDTFLNELNPQQKSIFMKLTDNTDNDLATSMDFSVLIGNKVTKDNYTQFLFYKTIKKEIFEFLLNTLIDANNTSCHVHRILYDRKKENKKLMYQKSKFSPGECCLEYVYQTMNDVGIDKSKYMSVISAFTSYIKFELENVVRLVLTRIIVKNKMIMETLQYKDAYFLVKDAVGTYPRLICDFIYKKSVNIAHVQKLFFNSGLEILNQLTEGCNIILKEKSSGGELNWRT